MRLAEAIVKRRIDQLAPYASNSRTHSAQQIAQIAASIREFGFTNPVLIDGEGTIVAGHARVLAAKELGLKQVPTIDIGYLSECLSENILIRWNRL
jgi:ParB-like chromosome segregation protein Spo0J